MHIPSVYFHIPQIIVSIFLVLLVLLQVREMGSGLFGSAQATFHTRRGIEKTMFQFTIVLAVVFILISILSVKFT